MTFQNYQQLAGQTAVYPNRGKNLLYPILGLIGETGEVCEKLKKEIRDQDNSQLILTDSKRAELQKELGDVLWYLTEVCTHFNISLEDIAETNINKLKARQESGTLKGDGDDR